LATYVKSKKSITCIIASYLIIDLCGTEMKTFF